MDRSEARKTLHRRSKPYNRGRLHGPTFPRRMPRECRRFGSHLAALSGSRYARDFRGDASPLRKCVGFLTMYQTRFRYDVERR